MKKLILAISLLLLLTCPAWATDYYVRKGATGANNGTSWVNAWTDVDQISWSSITGGDTIWLAGGSSRNNDHTGRE